MGSFKSSKQRQFWAADGHRQLFREISSDENLDNDKSEY
jgi:hypothetical protein